MITCLIGPAALGQGTGYCLNSKSPFETSALGEIGLPQTEIPAALLFFNVGVEVGQIIFVSAVLGLGWAGGPQLWSLSQNYLF